MNHTEKRGLKSPKNAEELLELYFLQARSCLLETAAIMDRLGRAKGGKEILKSPKVDKLRKCCELISAEGENRTARILNMLSVE